MKIENLAACTGCHACFSVCLKGAIVMAANDEGFLYPQIDVVKCVRCGQCERVCPALSPLRKEGEDTRAFAAINNDEKIRLESSSGGIFSALAQKVIDAGGAVFGAKFAPDFSIVHGWTDTAEGLADFRGSKYVQSVIGDSFKECKRFLDGSRKVLFSGTPCQIQGLKKYLGKEYENLLAVDCICHGVPSPLVWQKYVDFRAEKFGATRQEIVKTSFRRKNDGWKMYSLSFTFANDSEYIEPLNRDPYMQMFLRDECLRGSCYDCSCKSVARFSDITLADFWGVQTEVPDMDDDKGTSFLVVHSGKCTQALKSLENCTVREVALDAGLRHNPSLVKSVSRPQKRETFFRDLNALRFEKVIRRYATTPLYVRAYRFARRCTAKVIKLVVGKNNVERIKQACRSGA